MMISSDAHRLGILDSVLGAMSMGVIVLDSERRVMVWNAWMANTSGQPSSAAVGQDLFALWPELQGKRVDGAVRQALRDNFPSILSQTLHKAPFPLFVNAAARAADERMQQAVAITPLEAPGLPRLCLIQVHDVSMAVNREKLLRDQALELRSQTFSDGLTGIANRRHFDVAMEKELRRAKRSGAPLSLMMLDIDAFKPYNDHYGHQRGDACLVTVAGALAAMLQRPADLIARYGGEEFAVILPDMDATKGLAMAEAMRARVASLALPHAFSENAEHITISVGVATHNGTDDGDISTLLGAADRALYMAKRGGRNRVVAHGPGMAMAAASAPV